jgi:hypothetical protein
MDIATKLLVGILVSVVAWSITSISMFLLKRRRMRDALLCDIAIRAVNVVENRKYIEALFDDVIKEGKKIAYSCRYTRTDDSLYKSTLGELIRVSDRRTLLKITKAYTMLDELDILAEGFFLDITKWREKERILSEDDVRFLRKKKERILSMCDLAPKPEIKGLSDLRDDYQGKLGPESLLLPVVADRQGGKGADSG